MPNNTSQTFTLNNVSYDSSQLSKEGQNIFQLLREAQNELAKLETGCCDAIFCGSTTCEDKELKLDFFAIPNIKLGRHNFYLVICCAVKKLFFF